MQLTFSARHQHKNVLLFFLIITLQSDYTSPQTWLACVTSAAIKVQFPRVCCEVLQSHSWFASFYSLKASKASSVRLVADCSQLLFLCTSAMFMRCCARIQIKPHITLPNKHLYRSFGLDPFTNAFCEGMRNPMTKKCKYIPKVKWATVKSRCLWLFLPVLHNTLNLPGKKTHAVIFDPHFYLTTLLNGSFCMMSKDLTRGREEDQSGGLSRQFRGAQTAKCNHPVGTQDSHPVSDSLSHHMIYDG